MAETSIEWTDRNLNAVRGCRRKSSGCQNCYAEAIARRFSGPGMPYEGLVDDKGRFNGKVRFVPEVLDEPIRRRTPTKYFVNSTSDTFHSAVPDEFIADIYAVAVVARWHTFQILTKRPDQRLDLLTSKVWRKMVAEKAAALNNKLHERKLPQVYSIAASVNLGAWIEQGFVPNIWEGVSVESQEAADERIPLLLKTPAAERWLSCEPLLGPVDLDSDALDGNALNPECWGDCKCDSVFGYDPGCRKNGGDGKLTRKIDWVVVGGESGPGARPCNVGWVRSIVAQCKAASVPVFVKQLGANPEGDAPPPQVDPETGRRTITVRQTVTIRDRKGGDMSEWPEDLWIREYPKVK